MAQRSSPHFDFSFFICGIAYSHILSPVRSPIRRNHSFTFEIRKSASSTFGPFCKSKSICEADEQKEDGDGMEHAEEPKKGHGGCGHVQPQIRKESLKLFLQYKKSKNEEDEEFKAAHQEKRLFTPQEVYNVLRKIKR